MRGFVAAYMEEVTSTVPDVPGVDLTEYKAKLVDRFSNRQLSDQVSRYSLPLPPSSSSSLFAL